jgi:Fe-S cluster assembly ATPase SufC
MQTRFRQLNTLSKKNTRGDVRHYHRKKENVLVILIFLVNLDIGAGVVVITHYALILRYLSRLDHVNVMQKAESLNQGIKDSEEP